MIKKLFRVVLPVTPLLICSLFNLLERFSVRAQSLTGFRNITEQFVVMVCLLILGIFIFAPGITRENEQIGVILDQRPKNWFLGFATSFFVLVIFIGYVNPHARFPWKFYPFAYSTIHSEKVKLYRELDESPQIVVLGSSRAFTMPADYIEAISGYRTFNMAVTSATPLDMFTLEQYVIDHNQERPVLFIVEVLGRGLVNKSNEQDNMPLELLPYLPLRDANPIIAATFEDVFSLPSFSDALYMWLGFTVESKVVDHFQPDGTAVFKPREKPLSAKLQSQTIYAANYSCKTVGVGLNDAGKDDIEKLVQLSEEDKFGIVFYRSPLNGEFFNYLTAAQQKAFNQCTSAVNNYFIRLAKKHQNIFFLDLTKYEPVNQLGFEGFVDIHHPGRDASKMIVDALRHEINEGILWSIIHP